MSVHIGCALGFPGIRRFQEEGGGIVDRFTDLVPV